MLIERYSINYCNAVISTMPESVTTVLPNELFDVLKDYFIVVEDNIVYSEAISEIDTSD